MKPEQIVHAVLQLRNQHLAPVAESIGMPLAPDPSMRTPPMVLMLGNHSSGKSSLINHLLEKKVQRTGIAPTDDGFTVLMHGDTPRSVDGAALVSNPELPFAPLAGFGPGMVQHLEGRHLDSDLLRHIRLIDSPGMIDAAGAETERPYDFTAVVRWFADQADLILLFFDPEKPGTTGETLATLTEALIGIDHKLRIVMNKMDLFEGIRDFARTYGALCWNLSRSLQTKDLPHIYTTVIPDLVRDNCKLPLDGFAAALLELESYIADLPARRADSVLSRVMDETRQAIIQVRVLRLLKHKVWRAVRRSLLVCIGLTAIAAAATGYMATDQGPWDLSTLIAATVTLVLLASCWLVPRTIYRWREHLGVADLDRLFREAYHEDLARRDHTDDLAHQWNQVRPHLYKLLTSMGLRSVGRVRHARLKRLQHLLDVDLAQLRREHG